MNAIHLIFTYDYFNIETYYSNIKNLILKFDNEKRKKNGLFRDYN